MKKSIWAGVFNKNKTYGHSELDSKSVNDGFVV